MQWAWSSLKYPRTMIGLSSGRILASLASMAASLSVNGSGHSHPPHRRRLHFGQYSDIAFIRFPIRQTEQSVHCDRAAYKPVSHLRPLTRRNPAKRPLFGPRRADRERPLSLQLLLLLAARGF